MPGPVVVVPDLVLVLGVIGGQVLLVLERVLEVCLDLVKVLAALVEGLEEGALGRHRPELPGSPPLCRLASAFFVKGWIAEIVQFGGSKRALKLNLLLSNGVNFIKQEEEKR